MLGGGLILLLAAGLEVFKLDAELKFGNVTSNPNWIRPTPTAFDHLRSGLLSDCWS